MINCFQFCFNFTFDFNLRRYSEAVEYLVEAGDLFATTDNDRYQCAAAQDPVRAGASLAAAAAEDDAAYAASEAAAVASFRRAVLDIFEDPLTVRDGGMHISRVAMLLPVNVIATAGQIHQAVEYLVEAGDLFATTDNDHFQCAAAQAASDAAAILSSADAAPFAHDVLAVFNAHELGHRDEGMTIHEVFTELAGGISEYRVDEAVECLVSMGLIYCTNQYDGHPFVGDSDSHFRSTALPFRTDGAGAATANARAAATARASAAAAAARVGPCRLTR